MGWRRWQREVGSGRRRRGGEQVTGAGEVMDVMSGSIPCRLLLCFLCSLVHSHRRASLHGLTFPSWASAYCDSPQSTAVLTHIHGIFGSHEQLTSGGGMFGSGANQSTCCTPHSAPLDFISDRRGIDTWAERSGLIKAPGEHNGL